MAAETDEVWLRGNVRPVLGIGAVAVGGAAVATAAAAAGGAGATVVWPLGAAAVVGAGIVLALAWVAAGPRLGRRRTALLLRLSPRRVETVPLAVVECVFPGSRPLAGPVLADTTGDDSDAPAPAARRVGTLVIRFAERAVEWRERPTFAPWGVWREGHVIIDGRWCEPLSADAVRRIGARLLEAKREAAAAEAAG